MSRWKQYVLATGLALAVAAAARAQVAEPQPLPGGSTPGAAATQPGFPGAPGAGPVDPNQPVSSQPPGSDLPPPPPGTGGLDFSGIQSGGFPGAPAFNPGFNRFPIDPKTPVKDLLPRAPKSVKRAPALPRALTEVPEIAFEAPLRVPAQQPGGGATAVENPFDHIAHNVAKVNHLNGKETDGFLKELVKARPDLQGLPFRMGKDCRMSHLLSAHFSQSVRNTRSILSNPVNIPISQARDAEKLAAQQFWAQFRQASLNNSPDPEGLEAEQCEAVRQGEIRGLMQIMMPEAAEMQLGFVRYLATVPHQEATVSLARLAVFAQEARVRSAAVEALKVRRERDYTDVLRYGLRYPLPAAAKHAAEAVVQLERQDLIPALVALLEEADPRLPVAKDNGYEVREVVRLNHNRNCLLCHPAVNNQAAGPGPQADGVPGAATGGVPLPSAQPPAVTGPPPGGAGEATSVVVDFLITQASDVITAQIPVPGQPLPVDSSGGYGNSQPDILVRIDQTYLRQDFSVMLPVEGAEPWPEMQRFDFLVRTRPVGKAEAEALRALADTEPSPYREAALVALRGLTGRDAGTSAAAWRQALGLRE